MESFYFELSKLFRRVGINIIGIDIFFDISRRFTNCLIFRFIFTFVLTQHPRIFFLYIVKRYREYRNVIAITAVEATIFMVFSRRFIFMFLSSFCELICRVDFSSLSSFPSSSFKISSQSSSLIESTFLSNSTILVELLNFSYYLLGFSFSLLGCGLD